MGEELEGEAKEGGSVVWLVAVASLVLVGLVVGVPNLIESRKNGNETAALGALKSMRAAQSLFRSADLEGDGNLDYGTLAELGLVSHLVDEFLASGTKGGYLFEATYGASTSEFIWYATARPAHPWMGDRYYAINHEGAFFYTVSQPFSLNSADCDPPPGVQGNGF